MDPFKHDPDLLQRFRNGDHRALARVYRAFLPALRNFVLRGFAFKSSGRNVFFQGMIAQHDLDDITQETFRRAFGPKARQAYDGVRPYKNYLFTIARNAVLNDLSAKSRHVLVGELLSRDMPGEDLPAAENWLLTQWNLAGSDANPRSDDLLEALEASTLVAAFLEALPKDEQRFFQLRFLGRCSQETTARRLGFNRARVRKLEGRLRRAFMGHVRGSGYLEEHQLPATTNRRRPAAQPAVFVRARALWRHYSATQPSDFLGEAA